MDPTIGWMGGGRPAKASLTLPERVPDGRPNEVLTDRRRICEHGAAPEPSTARGGFHGWRATTTRRTDGGTVRERRRHRVILVREWEQQLSSSGCCGRIEGDFLDFGEGAGNGAGAGPAGRAFPGRRAEMERAGRLYRALKDRWGDRVEIRIVDPRNLLVLVPTLYRDARHHGASIPEALGSLLRLSVNCVVVDGRVVARNRWPEPGEVVRALEARASPAPGPSTSRTSRGARRPASRASRRLRRARRPAPGRRRPPGDPPPPPGRPR